MNRLVQRQHTLQPFDYRAPVGTALVHGKLPSEAELIDCFKRSLLEAMKASGVTEATVEYAGGGDSGDIVGVSFYNAQAESIDPHDGPIVSLPVVLISADHSYSWAPKLVSLREALEAFMWGAVYKHHAGWEINDGGRGCLRVTVAHADTPASVVLDHVDYYMEESHSSSEF